MRLYKLWVHHARCCIKKKISKFSVNSHWKCITQLSILFHFNYITKSNIAIRKRYLVSLFIWEANLLNTWPTKYQQRHKDRNWRIVRGRDSNPNLNVVYKISSFRLLSKIHLIHIPPPNTMRRKDKC